MEGNSEFLRLLLAHESELRAFVRSVVRRSNDQDDLFQEIAVALWKTFPRFDRDRSFVAWARGIAKLKLLQWKQQTNRAPLLISDEAIEAVASAFERTDNSRGQLSTLLEECLMRIKGRSREMLALRYEQSLPYCEIARLMQTTEAAAMQTLSRLRTRLEQCLKERQAASELTRP